MGPDFKFFLSILVLFLCQKSLLLSLYNSFPSWGTLLPPPPWWELTPNRVNDVVLPFFFFFSVPWQQKHPAILHSPHSSHPVTPNTSSFSGAFFLRVIICCAAVSAAAQIHLWAWLSAQPDSYSRLDPCSLPPCARSSHRRTERRKASSARSLPATVRALAPAPPCPASS